MFGAVAQIILVDERNETHRTLKIPGISGSRDRIVIDGDFLPLVDVAQGPETSAPGSR